MLIDTSGLLCLFDQKDLRHRKATEYYDSAPRRLSHNYVLAEFVALAGARRAPRLASLRFIDAISHSTEIEVVWIDQQLHDRALDLLKRRQDKVWSLCDAVSFLIMAESGIEEALTTDHHFEQAGFVQLLER
jgi:predicted nucleic acid-binding protein